jgi:hypothetical protein
MKKNDFRSFLTKKKMFFFCQKKCHFFSQKNVTFFDKIFDIFFGRKCVTFLINNTLYSNT